MIRTFLEYQIQRALDESPELPVWLRVVLRFSPHLRQFADDSRQLDSLLHTGARARHESLFEATGQSSRVELARRSVPKHDRALIGWLSAAALAASLAIAFFAHRATERHFNAEHARFLSQQFASVPEGMAMILTQAVNNPQLPRYNPLAQLKLPETNMFANVSTSTQASLKSQVDSVITPWQSLGEQFLSEWTPTSEPGT